MNQTSGTMKMMSESERPYEKCENLGVEYLSDAELLAVLIRSGSKGENALQLANRILYQSGEDGLLGLHQLKMERLRKIKGIGKVKAIQLSCIVELSKRLSKAKANEKLCFTNPSSIAQFYMEDLRHEKQEIIKLLMLNTKSQLIGDTNVSKGTVNATIITPRELFIEALQKDAVSIIVLHNHPSGDPTPSNEDLILTERIRTAGNMIGIELLDHIIIGNNCYVSFLEDGLLETKG